MAPTRTRRWDHAKGLVGGSNLRKTAVTSTQRTAEAYSTDSELRRAAKPSKALVRAALPTRRDKTRTQGMLVACVRAAACNPAFLCSSRGEPRSTGRTSVRDPARACRCRCRCRCSQDPTRGKDRTRDQDLKFAEVQRTTKGALSAGKVCRAGRTFLVAWSWGTPTRKVGEARGRSLGQGNEL